MIKGTLRIDTMGHFVTHSCCKKQDMNITAGYLGLTAGVLGVGHFEVCMIEEIKSNYHILRSNFVSPASLREVYIALTRDQTPPSEPPSPPLMKEFSAIPAYRHSCKLEFNLTPTQPNSTQHTEAENNEIEHKIRLL